MIDMDVFFDIHDTSFFSVLHYFHYCSHRAVLMLFIQYVLSECGIILVRTNAPYVFFIPCRVSYRFRLCILFSNFDVLICKSRFVHRGSFCVLFKSLCGGCFICYSYATVSGYQ
jgi:hypothetical protein